MRAFLAVALIVLCLAGCATPMPAKDDFGASALLAVGNIPPGFPEFNRFDAGTNDLIAGQLCATPAQRLEENAMQAVPGRFDSSSRAAAPTCRCSVRRLAAGSGRWGYAARSVPGAAAIPDL